MTLYRRPSVVGPDHFVIMHKESDGRELAIGFIHNPTRTHSHDSSEPGNGTSNIINVQDDRTRNGERATRSKTRWPH